MITGQNISLRPFDSCHLDNTRAWVNDSELAQLLDRAMPVSDTEHEQWFSGLHGRTDCIYFAIETNTKAQHIGNVWLWGIDWRHRKAELRIVIGDKNYLGRGIGTEAIFLICSYAFERLNLHKVYAYVLASNLRARSSFEKVGFIEEGVLKEDRWTGNCYSDVYLLGKLNK